jgi:hypothetical protein
MTNQSSQPVGTLPWTREQFSQMQTMLTETIPAQEDNLRRSKAAGLQVDDLINQLAASKLQLQKLIDAWKDKY